MMVCPVFIILSVESIFYVFFPIYFYPIVVNAGENNLDDIYTMLHHFQDDFIWWSSVFGPSFAVALGGYRYHIFDHFYMCNCFTLFL